MELYAGLCVDIYDTITFEVFCTLCDERNMRCLNTNVPIRDYHRACITDPDMGYIQVVAYGSTLRFVCLSKDAFEYVGGHTLFEIC